MQDSTKKLLIESDKLYGKPYRHLDILKCYFKLDYNQIIFELDTISVNSIDMNCDQEQLYKGPFSIRFNKEIQLEHGNIKICEWNKDDQVLKINDEEFKYLDTDFVYFIGDLKANTNDTINNVMKRFCEWVKREYI